MHHRVQISRLPLAAARFRSRRGKCVRITDQSLDRPARQRRRGIITADHDGEYLVANFLVRQRLTFGAKQQIDDVVVLELRVASTAGDLVEHQPLATL